MMPPRDRLDWIVRYLADRGVPGSVLDAEFVQAYIEATGASYEPMPYGAHRCRVLGRDLSELYREGRASRRRVGISGMGYGFPKWVWDYECAIKPGVVELSKDVGKEMRHRRMIPAAPLSDDRTE